MKFDMPKNIKYGSPRMLKKYEEKEKLNTDIEESKNIDFSNVGISDKLSEPVVITDNKKIIKEEVKKDVYIEAGNDIESWSKDIVNEKELVELVINNSEVDSVLSKKKVVKSKKVKCVQVYNPDEKILKKLKSEYGFSKSGAYKFALLQLSKNLNLS